MFVSKYLFLMFNNLRCDESRFIVLSDKITLPTFTYLAKDRILKYIINKKRYN